MKFSDTDNTVFVERRDGVVCGIWLNRQNEGQEELKDGHAEVVAFRNRPEPAAPPTVRDLMRVLAITDAAIEASK